MHGGRKEADTFSTGDEIAGATWLTFSHICTIIEI